MPVIPSSIPRVSMEAPRLRGPAPDPYGPIALRALDLHERINGAYEETEATRIAGEASANLSGAVKAASLEYGNPDEFAVKAAEGVQSVYDNAIKTAGSDRIRAKVQAKLADNYNNARNGIALDTIKKKADITVANWELQKAQAAKDFATLDDAGKQTKLTEMKAEALNLANRGILSHTQAAKEVLEMEKQGWREDAALLAASEPIRFQDAVDQGRYKGKLSGSDLQTAQDIAERVTRAREAKDARFSAARARIDEEDHYQAAKRKELNEDKLRQDQRLYGWSEEKVNAIMKVQLGLRTSDPYADQLIAHAMRLEDPINPTPKMIQNAQARLERLVESGKVSRDSTEYQRQVTNLRIMNQTASRSNNPVNQEKSRTKTYLRDYLNSQAPDMDAEEKRKLLGTYNVEIDKAEAKDLGAIRQRFEKEFSDKKKVQDPGSDAMKRLRGLTK